MQIMIYIQNHQNYKNTSDFIANTKHNVIFYVTISLHVYVF